MTAILPAVAPPPPPDDVEMTVSKPEVAPELVDYRRRYRRRLLLWSLPAVLVVFLVALKLLSLPLLAGVSQASYDQRSYDQTVASSDGLGPVNVLEPWVRYFDRGTGLGKIGVLVDSRTALEHALALVPSSNVPASCRVRTDLLLIVEQQGDSAVLDQDFTGATAFYKHALALFDGAPAGCLNTPNDPKGPPTKQPLQDAHGRLEQKEKQAQQQAGGGSSTGSGSGSGGQGQGGSQNGQGQNDQSQGKGSSGSSKNPLDQLQKQNDQAQKDQQQNNDRNRYFQQNPEQYSGKPW